ncbi:TonB-dependent receptor plug domain-containing protein [Sphingomonas sp. URHD0057]|uniref:TonB-dependent receptor plug domain-containing protein n=1 Tax=Sphingomonas sp. URHD0057 TaxID=1380389 RepID=UPI000AAC5052|nr:outer membrane beta-barrel protein [Sphingomonas sp. URHD0057]
MPNAVLLATVATAALITATSATAQAPSPSAPAPSPTMAAQAAPASQSGRTTNYDAAFFAQYAPRTALDIAQRVPGFALDLGDSNVRGFAGAAGNVVLNGSRPSSKSESLQQTLSRIPAQQVVRVEVGPGDLYGADYAGKTQVLNIILSAAPGRGIEGNFTGSLRRYSNEHLLVPDATASVVLHRGPSEFNLSAGLNRTDYIENGIDDFRVPAQGPTAERRIKVNHYYIRQPFAAINWTLGSAADHTIHLNARIQEDKNGVRPQTNHVIPANGPEHDDELFQRYNQPGFEVGGDISRPLGGGAIKLVGLATRKRRDYEDIYTGGPPVLGGFRQVQKARQAETIGRLSWTRSNLAGFSVDAGVEAAYNNLDNHLTFSIINADGSEKPVDLPIDNATVSEKRAEGYLTVGRSLTSTLHLDGGVRFETSKLKVRGDAEADRSLSFFKPNLALDWNDNGWHARAAVQRVVAQLNFYDFISAADISAGRVNGGNANLVPQQTWQYRFTVEHPLLKTGLVKLDLGYDKVNQLQDRILNDDGLDAPGNLGTGTRRFASINVNAPLDRLGIKGGRLTATGTLQKTRVEDPSTHEMRHWTDFWPAWQWQVDYRQDLGQWSYGASLQDRAHYTLFRTDEIDDFKNAGAYGSAFIEFRPNSKTTVTLDVDNMLNTKALRHRTFFRPNRTNPVPWASEFRPRNKHVDFGLTLKRTF